MTAFQDSPRSVTWDGANTRLPASGDDAGDGLLMFIMFIAAVMMSTAAVVLIALIGESWVLGFAFAIHVIMTAIVVLTIMHAMAGRRDSTADRDPLRGTSPSPRRSLARSHYDGSRTVPAVPSDRRRASSSSTSERTARRAGRAGVESPGDGSRRDATAAVPGERSAMPNV